MRRAQNGNDPKRLAPLTANNVPWSIYSQSVDIDGLIDEPA